MPIRLPLMRPALLIAVTALVLSACAPLRPAESPAWPRETVAYRCAEGTRLQVAYLNLEDRRSYAALYYDGRLSLMRAWPAASGARYVSIDEEVGLRWHTRGDAGILSFLAADHTARQTTLATDCRREQ